MKGRPFPPVIVKAGSLDFSVFSEFSQLCICSYETSRQRGNPIVRNTVWITGLCSCANTVMLTRFFYSGIVCHEVDWPQSHFWIWPKATQQWGTETCFQTNKSINNKAKTLYYKQAGKSDVYFLNKCYSYGHEYDKYNNTSQATNKLTASATLNLV